MTMTMKELLLTSDPVGRLRQIHSIRKSGNITALRELEPSLADLLMDIPEGYNHKNNLEHSFKVLQNAIDREPAGPDLILRTAALFHDVGKPATRAFEKNGVVSFTNHDFVGAKMIHGILSRHDYTKEEIRLIAKLILLHMRSHTFAEGWSESAARRLMVDAESEVQLQRLIIIFYADTTSGHAHRREEIYAQVDALAEELSRVAAKDARAKLRPALNGVEIQELLGIAPGPELGLVMKFLNTDVMVTRSKEEAITEVLAMFGK